METITCYSCQPPLGPPGCDMSQNTATTTDTHHPPTSANLSMAHDNAIEAATNTVPSQHATHTPYVLNHFRRGGYRGGPQIFGRTIADIRHSQNGKKAQFVWSKALQSHIGETSRWEELEFCTHSSYDMIGPLGLAADGLVNLLPHESIPMNPEFAIIWNF